MNRTDKNTQNKTTSRNKTRRCYLSKTIMEGATENGEKQNHFIYRRNNPDSEHLGRIAGNVIRFQHQVKRNQNKNRFEKN